jgi:hypothetical protein
MIDDYESPTVIRLLVSIASQLTVTPNGGGVIAAGIYVATGDEDDAALPTIIWDPGLDQPSDWMWRYVSPVPTGNNVGQFYFNQSNDKGYDSRAKRKVPRGAGLLMVFQSLEIGGSVVAANIAADVRCLIISG